MRDGPRARCSGEAELFSGSLRQKHASQQCDACPPSAVLVAFSAELHTDSAGGTPAFLNWLFKRGRWLSHSVGKAITDATRPS